MVTVSGNSNPTNPTAINSGVLTDKNPVSVHNIESMTMDFRILQ